MFRHNMFQSWRKQFGFLVVLSTLLSGLVPVANAASAPNIITYQGRVLNANGVPVANTSLSMSFALYTASSGGTCVWSNSSATCASVTARSVTLTTGLFTENLGDTSNSYAAIGDSVFSDNETLYLEVIIAGETLSPRRQITAAPYALNADTLDGIDSTVLQLFETGSSRTFEDDAPVIIGTNAALTYGSGGVGDLRVEDELEVMGNGYIDNNLVVGASTSSTETIANVGFSLGGDDLFVAGMMGVEGTIYTDGSLDVVGTASVGDLTCTDCLDFTELSDTLALDASTSIAMDGSEAFTITNGGSGNVVVNLSSTGDFVIQDNGAAVLTLADDDVLSYATDLTTTSAMTFTGNSLTTGTLLSLSSTALTTGSALSVTATNANTANSATRLSQLSFTNSQATNANSDITGLLVNFTNNPSVAGNTERAVAITNVSTSNTTDNALSTLLFLDNADTSTTGSTVVTDAVSITVSGSISDGIIDAIDASDANITNALNFGANTIIGTTGNIDLTNFDVTGSSGSITTAGDLAVNGDDITADGATLTINAGGTVEIQDNLTITTGTTISAASVTAFNCTDCIDFDDLSDSATLDASTAIGFGAGALSLTFTNNGTGNEVHNLSSTGDFVIQDNGTPFLTFADDDTVTYTTDLASTTAVGFTGNSIDTGTLMALTANALTSGSGQTISSSSTAMTGSLQSITLSGSNVANTGTLLALSSSGAASIARALNVAVSSTGAPTNGFVRFNFTGDHTGNGFQINDVTTTGNVATIADNAITGGDLLSISSSSAGAFGTDGAVDFTFSGAHTGTAVAITDDSTLTGNVLDISADALTSGTGVAISSTSTGTTGSLLSVSSASTGTFANGGVYLDFSGAHTGPAVSISTATTTGNGLILRGDSLTSGDLLRVSSSSAGNFTDDAAIDFLFSGAFTGSAFNITAPATVTGSVLSIGTVDGNVLTSGRIFEVNTSSTAWTGTYIAKFGATGADGNVVRIQDSNGTCDHNPGAATEAVSCASDARLKENIEDAGNVLDEINAFTVRQYDWKATGDHFDAGVIAQEVLETPASYMVHMGEDGYYMVEEYNSWKLVKGIQELSARIDALSRQNTASGVSAGSISDLNLNGNISMTGNQILDIGRLVGLHNNWSIEETGTFTTTGVYKAAIESTQGTDVEVYASMSPEVSLTLSGTSTLSNGQAVIEFEQVDSEFNDIISSIAPIRVLITPNGPTSILYVSQKSNNGFSVQEVGGTTSDVSFDWLVIAYRRGYEPTQEQSMTEDFMTEVVTEPAVEIDGVVSFEVQEIMTDEIPESVVEEETSASEFSNEEVVELTPEVTEVTASEPAEVTVIVE